MSIYSKLAEARVELQKKGVTPSGINTFSKFTYFELKDFLPSINEIFDEKKLCGVVSFTEQIATLTIHDSESDEKITFTSPMATATLKGCHAIQNLGAVQTYQRRYLYMTALEISENDELEISENDELNKNKGNDSIKEEQKSNTKLSNNIDPQVVLNGYKDAMTKAETLELVEKYKASIIAKLNDHPEKLQEAILIYNDKKKAIEGV